MRTLVLSGTALLPLAAVLAAPAPPTPPAAFDRCAGCHAVDQGEPAEVGPNLWGVAGAKAGSRPGYGYSAALRNSGVVWNAATLDRWLMDDQKMVPGTTMPNQALPAPERAAVVRYLLMLK